MFLNFLLEGGDNSCFLPPTILSKKIEQFQVEETNQNGLDKTFSIMHFLSEPTFSYQYVFIISICHKMFVLFSAYQNGIGSLTYQPALSFHGANI